MNVFQTLPFPILRPFVDRLWGWESTNGEVVQLPTLLPGTGAELYFHYRTPFRYASDNGQQESCDAGHLFCIRRRPLQLSPSSNVGFIAVRFKVGMIHRFTDIPGEALSDRVLSAEDIWGVPGAALVRRLSHAGTLDEKLSLVQSFLIEHLRREPPDFLVEKSMTMLYRQGASISIQALADRLHLGRRQLERRFKALSGQSPGELKQLSRFQHTVRQLMLNTSTGLADAALDHGYYDQAHFIHDFQRFANATPLQYLGNARAKMHFYNTSRCAAGNLRAPNELV